MDQDKKPQEEPTGEINKGAILSILAYPISAISAYFPLKIFARSNIYKNYAKEGYFDDLQKKYGIKRTAIKNEVLADMDNALAHNVPEKTNILRAAYRQEADARFRKMGINGVGQYWKGLHPNQKFEVAFSALTAAGISLGAILTMANNMDRLKKWFGRKNDSDDSSMTR